MKTNKDKRIKERDVLLGLFSSAGVFYMINNLSIFLYFFPNLHFSFYLGKFIFPFIEIILFLLIGYFLLKRINLSKLFRKTFIITYLILLCFRIIYYLIALF
jgi:hypothetical protein